MRSSFIYLFISMNHKNFFFSDFFFFYILAFLEGIAFALF